MNSDFLMCLRALLSGVWKIFTSWNIPGTNVSPAALGVTLLAMWVVIKFVLRFNRLPFGDGEKDE